jgi:flagellar motor switch protein FliN/FliY
MTIAVPYSWLKQISRSELEKEEGTPFGYPPPFPWEQLSAVLGKLFQVNGLEIIPSAAELRNDQELLAGLGSDPIPLYLDIAPLKGTLCWIMAAKEREQLMSLLLTRHVESDILIDNDYSEAFYQFMALEVINICGKLEYEKGISPHLLNKKELPTEGSYCNDVLIKLEGLSFNGRIVISNELQLAWKERYAKRTLDTEISDSLANKIYVTLCLEGGNSTLPLSLWKSAAPGDFLLLDRCGLRPEEGKGMVTVTLNQQPLFLAQVKGGNVKILDYPLYHEAPKAMVNTEDDDEDLDDFDIDFETEETSVEDEAAHGADGENESQAEQVSTAATAPARSTEPVKASTLRAEPGKPIDVKDLTVNLVVEVGRIEMSITKLRELQPGALLELDVHPEDGVDLSINGQLVGKGELLKIGDILGIRILER